MKKIKKIFDTIIALLIWPIAAITFAVSAWIYLFVAIFIPPKQLHPLAKFLCRLMLLGGGQIIKQTGNPPNPKDGPYLYLFNHQSLFDQFVVAGTLDEYISAVAGQFQFDWFIWGRLVKRYGAIPIIRKNLEKAIHSLNLAEDEIRKGTSFLVSPEGTRTLTGKMGEFKKGPFHLSLNTGVTIVPIGLIGVYNAKKREDWKIYPGIVKIIYGKPIKSDYYKNMTVEELRDDIHSRIALLCNDDLAVAH